MEDFDPDKIPKFSMPNSVLKKIYEFSGSSEENRGFLLFFVDQNGVPEVISQSSSAIVEMGIRKAAESYLCELEEATRPNINPEED